MFCCCLYLVLKTENIFASAVEQDTEENARHYHHFGIGEHRGPRSLTSSREEELRDWVPVLLTTIIDEHFCM